VTVPGIKMEVPILAVRLFLCLLVVGYISAESACNELENEVNAYRRSLGLSAHKCDLNLRRMSKAKSIDQTEVNKLGHCWHNKKYSDTCGKCNSNGCVYKTFFNGDGWSAQAENSSGAAECGIPTVVQHTKVCGNTEYTSWKDSAGHDKTMKSNKYTRMGCDTHGKFANCNFAAHFND